MGDQLEIRLWADHHQAFSADVDRALKAVRAALHRAAAWDGTSHQLLALVLAFAITALTFNTTTSA